jgi:hypothetical protein
VKRLTLAVACLALAGCGSGGAESDAGPHAASPAALRPHLVHWRGAMLIWAGSIKHGENLLSEAGGSLPALMTAGSDSRVRTENALVVIKECQASGPPDISNPAIASDMFAYVAQLKRACDAFSAVAADIEASLENNDVPRLRAAAARLRVADGMLDDARNAANSYALKKYGPNS